MIVTNARNPRFNSAINPRFNSAINPRFNSAINPRFNSAINPNITACISGLYLFDWQTQQLSGFAVPANAMTFVVFDTKLNFSGISTKATDNVYAWFNAESVYVGEWVVASASAYIIFNESMQSVGVAT